MVDFAISTSDFEYFLLVFVRMTSFMHLAPFYGEESVPSRFKVALSLFLSFIVFSLSNPREVAYETLLQYGFLIIKEAVVGLLIGLGAMMCMHMVTMAGRLIDMEIGLSAASLMDPTFRDSATITGVFYKFIFTALIITTGTYQYILKAIMQTYELIPIGGVHPAMGSLLETITSFMGQYFLISFQIALPVFAVILTMNVVLAVLAKVAPQMNLFAVGMQIKILAGLAVVYIAMWVIPLAAELLFKQMRTMIVSIVEGLM